MRCPDDFGDPCPGTGDDECRNCIYLRASARREIHLCLPYPVSANRYWRHITRKIRGRLQAVVVVSDQALAYRERVAWMCNAEKVKPLNGDVQVVFRLYPNKGRCMDVDNAQKVTLDSLQGFAFRNDSQVADVRTIRMARDEKGGRIEVDIREI